MWNNISVYLAFCVIIEYDIKYMYMLNVVLLIILDKKNSVHYYLYEFHFEYIHTSTTCVMFKNWVNQLQIKHKTFVFNDFSVGYM